MKQLSVSLFSLIVLFVSYSPKSLATNIGDVVDVIRDIADGPDYYRRAPDHRGDHGDRGDRGDRGGRGDSCQAYDRGHEEHYGGHDSCRTCLRFHGECVERCDRSVVRCFASGSDFHHEYEIRRPGVSQYDYEAKNEALQICRNEGLHGCRITRCDRSRGEVSTRLCSRRF